MDDYPDESEMPLSQAVVGAVAAREGVDPADVTEPLYNVINTDALNMLFTPRHETDHHQQGRVSFPYAGYDVTVYSDGRVELTDQE